MFKLINLTSGQQGEHEFERIMRPDNPINPAMTSNSANSVSYTDWRGNNQQIPPMDARFSVIVSPAISGSVLDSNYYTRVNKYDQWFGSISGIPCPMRLDSERSYLPGDIVWCQSYSVTPDGYLLVQPLYEVSSQKKLVQFTATNGQAPYDLENYWTITNVTNTDPAVITVTGYPGESPPPLATGQIYAIDGTGLPNLDEQWFPICALSDTTFSVDAAAGGTSSSGSATAQQAYSWQEAYINSSGLCFPVSGGATGNYNAYEINYQGLPLYDPKNPLQFFPFYGYIYPSVTVQVPASGTSWATTRPYQLYSFTMPPFITGMTYDFNPYFNNVKLNVPSGETYGQTRCMWAVIDNYFQRGGTSVCKAYFDYVINASYYDLSGGSYPGMGLAAGFEFFMNDISNGAGMFGGVSIPTAQSSGIVCGTTYLEAIYDEGNEGSYDGYYTCYPSCNVISGNKIVSISGVSTGDIVKGMYLNDFGLVSAITGNTQLSLEVAPGFSTHGVVPCMPTCQVWAQLSPNNGYSTTGCFAPWSGGSILVYGSQNPLVPTVGVT